MFLDIVMANVNAIVNYIPLFILSIMSLNVRLSRRLTFLLLGIYCLVTLAASILFSYFWTDNVFSKNYVFILIVPLLIFYLIIIEDNIARALYVFFSLFTYTLFIDINSSMLSSAVYSETNPFLFNIIVKLMLHAILFYPIYKYVTVPCNKIMKFADKNYWYVLSLLPMVVSFCALMLPKEGFLSIESQEFFVLNAVCIFSFAVFFLVFYMFKKTIEIIDLQNSMTLAKNQLALQREHYKQLSESIMNLRKYQHDTKYHLLTLTGLADSNDMDGIKAYLKDILKNRQGMAVNSVCSHYAADAIIKHYIMLAESRNIKITANVNIPADVSIDSFDLSIVLGNSLDNAIEACEKLPFESDRKIELTSDIKNSYLIIKVSNTYNGEIISGQGLPPTTKSSEGHGLGLLNIKTAAEKYKGNMSIETEGNRFTVTIAMFTLCNENESIKK